MNNLRIKAIFICLNFASVAGCGGAAQNVTVSEFTGEHAKYFENGVDFISDPDALDERWSEEWQRDLENRTDLSDFVGIANITTLVADQSPERQTSYRLVASIIRAMQGESPTEELSLAVAGDDAGYPVVESNQQRILNRRFAVFIKWYRKSKNEVVARWHLSPASEKLIGRLEGLVSRKHSTKKYVHVVVHKD